MADEGLPPPDSGINLLRPWRQQADKMYFSVPCRGTCTAKKTVRRHELQITRFGLKLWPSE